MKDNLRAGFSEIDITPPLGTKKGGWMVDLTAEKILDPLYAKAAVFDNGAERIGFIALDLLSIRWTQVNEIRARIESQFGFPGRTIMVSATHNHAGPAIAQLAPVPRDDVYVETLTQRCVKVFGEALAAMSEARVGFDHALESGINHNRRVLMRSGRVRTHGGAADERRDILTLEGPIDPEVAVLAVKDRAGSLMGCLMNFTCHPTHEGGNTHISAGYPGKAADLMRQRGCPVMLFLNGAYANTAPEDHLRQTGNSMEKMGAVLADHAVTLIAGMAFEDEAVLGAVSATVVLQHRPATDDERRGLVFGAQRFRDDALYNGFIDEFLAKAKAKPNQPAEVQVLRIGNQYFTGIPAEYFVEFQLDIKLQAYPKHALVVGGANGMVGYVPTRAAFERGGYETTFGPPSRTAAGSGEALADRAVALIKEV